MERSVSRFGRPLMVAAMTSVLALSACGKSESAGGSGAATGNAPAAAQSTQPAAAGPTCSLQQFGGSAVDLKTAKVGFSQSEKEANPFRIAETKSIRDEAAKLGITGNLTVTNGQSDFSKQLNDVQQMITSGVQLLVIAPLNSDGWDSVLQQAAAKKVPIITIDRKINSSFCQGGYVTFIGSDFVEQGTRAARQMAKALGNKGKVAILLGASGNNVTTERTQGFKDEIAKIAPDIKIAFEQTGEFSREKGQQVTEQLIQAQPDIDGIYGENDEMALGAVTALKSAGKKPGDVKIVSIDGTKGAVQGIVDGWFSAVVESNPRFGPLAFSTATSFFGGTPIPDKVVIQDQEYDTANAATGVSGAY